MTDRWNPDTLNAFYESQRAFPTVFEQLIAEDPVGRMWHSARESLARFHAAKKKVRKIEVGGVSTDPAQSAELAEVMRVAMSDRFRAVVGLEAACAALNGYQAAEEPRTSYFKHMITYYRRGRKDPVEVFRLQGLISELEKIADNCFNGLFQ